MRGYENCIDGSKLICANIAGKYKEDRPSNTSNHKMRGLIGCTKILSC